MNANFVMPIPRTWLFSRSGNSRRMLKTPVTEIFSALGVLNDYVLYKSTHSLRVSRRGHVRTCLAPGAGGRDRRCWEERSVLAGTDSGSERPVPATTIVTVAQRAARQSPPLCSRHPARCRTPTERRILNSCRARARAWTDAGHRLQPVAPPGGAGEASPPLWADVQKLCNMCVLSLSWNFFVSHHTTNTLQGRRAKSHVDTQTIQPGLGDFVL